MENLYLVQIPDMKKLSWLLLILIIARKNDSKENPDKSTEVRNVFTEVTIEPILENDSLSIRAIEVIGTNLAFAGNNGMYGLFNAANNSWKKLSEEGFYTLRFANDSIAYAAGKGRIAKLRFR